VQRDLQRTLDDVVWLHLDVLKAWQGRNEKEGFVEFQALFQVSGNEGHNGRKPENAPKQMYKELAYFVKHEEKWLYMEPIESNEWRHSQ
jgi:uncharacterized protein YchJ